MAGFNPLDDGGADASSSGATVAWCEQRAFSSGGEAWGVLVGRCMVHGVLTVRTPPAHAPFLRPADRLPACLPRPAATPPRRQDLSEEVVAHVDAVVGEPAASAAPAAEAGAAEELLGLDLHALASSDLPEHHEPAELAQQ